MNYKVLYRKYRPDNFDSVCGQNYSIKILKNSINNDKISHAYLFTGPRGTGKTSTAKIFAKAINCLNPIDGNPCGKCDCCLNTLENPDIIEIDAASNNGVDEIREIINNVKIAPSFSKYKVYIIDEVHMLSTSAFNALLLTLEEPPGHVVFILATTEVQDVPITILSRCQRFDFKPIDNSIIYDRLKYICDTEKIIIDDEAIKEIAYVSNGGLRDALSILDQLSGTSDKISVDDVYSNFGTVSNIKIEKLIEAYTGKKSDIIVDLINEFKENGCNYSVLIEKIIDKLSDLAYQIKIGKNQEVDFDNIYDLIFDLNNCLNVINININPYLLIEMTLLKHFDQKKNIELFDFSKIDKQENKISQEIIISQEIKNDKKEEIISREIKNDLEKTNNNNELTVVDSSLVNIRVNNCFVSANKEYKKLITDRWNDFKDYLDSFDKSLYSLIVDSEIVLASDKYAVIMVESLSTCKLINKKIDELEEFFNKDNEYNYKLICLSSNEWNEQMNIFKNNKKNGIIYEYIDEPSNINNKEEVNELDSLAMNIFDNDVIEYE